MSEPKRYDVGMTTENNPHGFNHSFPWVYEAEQGKFVEYSDYARLKAEVAKWWNTHMPPIDNHIAQLEAENARLKAEVERLTKAGDNLARVCRGIYGGLPLWEEWNAAKGVQS